MQGKAVLSPFGFDSFGLPAENAAIKTGTHPRVFTEARMAELKASLIRLGAVYDWRREIWSHDPAYIKWNQVIFLKLWEAGLAYRRKAPVNWCPGCMTVLANEQVLADGTCERSGDLVERRDLEQWFFRITAYADELLEALDDLDWPDRVKVMQRNWIGRSEGAEFDLVGRWQRGPEPPCLHDPARHQLRHDLCRHCARASASRRADDRRAARRGRGAPPPGQRGDRHRADERGRPGLARQAGRLHRHPRDQPVQRRAGAAVRGRLRPHGLRHGGDHGRAGRGRARLGLRQDPRPSDRAHRPAAGRLGRRRRRRLQRATASRSTAASSTGST